MQYPPLTPSVLRFGANVTLLKDCVDSDPDFIQSIPSKVFKHIQTCKEKLWERWNLEYLLTLHERHNCANGKNVSLKVRDIVQIKSEQKNREKWKIGLITTTILVDDVLVCAKIKLVNNILLERSVLCSILWRFPVM